MNRVIEERKERKPPSRLKSREFKVSKGVLWGVTGVTAAAVLCAVVWAVSFYGDIYPGVNVSGVDLGGLSEQEATQILDETYAKKYEDKALDLTVDGITLKISAQQVGMSFETGEVVQKAYSVGRDGSFFARLGKVLASPFKTTALEVSEEVYINRSALDKLLLSLSERLDVPVKEYQWDIMDDGILVENAAKGRSVPTEELAELIESKIIQGDFTPVVYSTVTHHPADLDLNVLYEEIYVEPVNAYLDVSHKNDAKVMPHVTGVSFNMEEATQLLNTTLESFLIPFVYTQPEFTKTKLEENLFRDVLGKYSTSLSSSSNARTGNIAKAAEYINGTILLPGEEFSYNQVVGIRTKERGFKDAGAFVNGQLVDEVGGGICQMSSTLYNAVLLANLKISERRAHSMQVAYVPRGLDATVNWGTIDFRFINDTGYPIKILTHVEGKQVYSSIVGTKTDNITVKMTTSTVNKNPYTVITKVNANLEPGTKKVTVSGHDGYTVESYRILLDSNGKEISRSFESRSTYRRVDEVVEVGPTAQSSLEEKPDSSLDGEPNAAPDAAPEPDSEQKPEETQGDGA